MKTKKKVLGVFNGSFEIYTRYFQKKCKKFSRPQAVKRGAQSHNLKLTLDILELMMKSKKK